MSKKYMMLFRVLVIAVFGLVTLRAYADVGAVVSLSDNDFKYTYRVHFQPTQEATLMRVERVSYRSDSLFIPAYIEVEGYRFRVTTICSGSRSEINCSVISPRELCPSYIDASSIVNLGDYAFWICRSLKEIVLSDSLRTIGDYALHSCSGIKDLYCRNVSRIGKDALSGTSNLEKIVFGDNLTEIRYAAMQSTGLRTVNLHNIKSAADNILTSNEFLKEVIADSLETMFSLRNTAVRNIVFPEVISADLTGLINVHVDLPKMKRLTAYSATLDYLRIPTQFRNTEINYAISPDSFRYVTIDSICIDSNNPSFSVRDSLLLGSFREYSTDTEPTTIALASIGFPRGGCFVPHNNPYNGVAFNCDYIDSLVINQDFDPTIRHHQYDEGYHFKTYTRSEDNPVHVYIKTQNQYIEGLLKCFPDMRDISFFKFFIPEGSGLRFLAAGWPADKLFEVNGGSVNEIEPITSNNGSIRASALKIIFQDFAPGSDFMVSSVDGSIVAKGIIGQDGSATVNLPNAGIYVVRCDNRSLKVACHN